MKKFISILLTLSMIMLCVTPVFGKDENIPSFTPNSGVISEAGAETLVNNVLGLVQFVGIAIAVGMLLYIGIKYMMASANEKADLKKGSINYVIGAIVLLGATGIVTIIQSFATSATGK